MGHAVTLREARLDLVAHGTVFRTLGTGARPKPTLIVYTDASKLGWGYSYNNVTNSGVWSAAEAAMHINVLETRVVRLTLEHAPQVFAGHSVCFCLDNVSAAYYLNKQGGTRSSVLMTEARTVLLLAERLDVHVTAVHVRGELNVLADMLSRRTSVIKTEWRLSDAAFQWLCANSPWGTPTCELFANRLNHHLPRYMSPCPDDQAYALDALVCPWPNEVLYAFPPFTLLDRVLLKILQERPRTLLLVAPSRPTATWFPTLQDLTVQKRCFPNECLQLLQPHTSVQMPSVQQLSLALWAIQCRD